MIKTLWKNARLPNGLIVNILIGDSRIIEIGSDGEFTLANGVSSGTGTALDPFIIEGWSIIVATGHGIYIHDTLAHFIVRDCFIDAGTGLNYPDYDSSIDSMEEDDITTLSGN